MKYREDKTRRSQLFAINKAKYRYPPTLDDVKRTLEKYNMSARSFEKFFGLGERCINNMKYQGIPPWTWHIWLEDIDVKFGYGVWEEEYLKKQHEGVQEVGKKVQARKKEKTKYSHNRLNILK